MCEAGDSQEWGRELPPWALRSRLRPSVHLGDATERGKEPWEQTRILVEELKIPTTSDGKSTPFSPSPFPDSRDRFSAPVPSDWLLFPWQLLFAYSKPPSPSSWTKTPLPSPKPSPSFHPHPQQQLRGVKSGKFWAGRCSREGSGVCLPLLAEPVGMAVKEKE